MVYFWDVTAWYWLKLSKTYSVLSSCYLVFFAFKTLRFPSVSFGDLNAAQILQPVEEMQVNKIITVHILQLMMKIDLTVTYFSRILVLLLAEI